MKNKFDELAESLAQSVESVLTRFGHIDCLINGAGGNKPQATTNPDANFFDLSADALRWVLNLNVLGTILCCREAVLHMSTARGGRGGAIVNISSLAARTGGSGEWVHYAASKGAIDSFTIGLAREVAAEGIRVNAVAPGLIATELHSANGAPDRLERLKRTIPMQRAGTAEEVAAGVLWLLSPGAAYTTGTILEIGGGR